MREPRIDPTVDCVFKAILGRDSNVVALIHFLNAVMKLEESSRIKKVWILNPYNEREFIEDKLTVVDVKAVDEQNNHYQIEIQLVLTQALESRMLYTWSAIYHSLLQKGESFEELTKVTSIWILGECLFPDVGDYHLPFSICNLAHKLLLTDHLQIHLLQLPLWQWKGSIQDELDRWMYVFTKGKNMDVYHPPEFLQTREIKPVMDTLRQFYENHADYLEYESRRIAQIQVNTDKKIKERQQAEYKKMEEEKERMQEEKERMQEEKERMQEEKERMQEEKERILEEKERILGEKERMQGEKERILEEKERIQAELLQERKEKERLLSLLKQAGINPTPM